MPGMAMPLWPTPRIVGLPGDPGESIDQRILADVLFIEKNFKVRVTDGYAPTGHAAGGEHPRGLAVDVVPDTRRGGTWDDVDRLAAWAEPKQNDPRDPFRWVGYTGDPNHGRGNHLHLSWGHIGPNVKTIRSTSGKGGGTSFGDIAKDALGVAGDVSGAAHVLGSVAGGPLAFGGTVLTNKLLGLTGDVTDAATKAALTPAKLAMDALLKVLGATGAEILIYAVLILGGAALAFYGFARATGVDDELAKAGKTAATMAVTRGAVK